MDVKTIIKGLNDAGIANDLFKVVGLETRSSGFAKFIGGIGVFAAGALVGTGIGLAFAPMAGNDFRIKAKAYGDQVKSKLIAMKPELANVGETLSKTVSGKSKNTRTPSTSTY